MLPNDLLKLKASLGDALQKWIDDEAEKEEWPQLDTHIGDFTSELMADAAFTVLLAQRDLTQHYESNDMLQS